MNRKQRWYFWALRILIVASFAVVVTRLAKLQVGGRDDYGEDYGAIAESTMSKRIYEHGTRGQILDVNGAMLAGDRKIYNITFYRNPTSGREENGEYSKAIWEIIQLVRKDGKEVKFNFWLRRDESGQWIFDAKTEDQGISSARERMFRQNFYLSTLPIAGMFDKLCENYMIHEIDKGLPDEQKLSEADKLQVLSVWQEMQMNAFNSIPITLVKDVSWSSVMGIETRLVSLPGISVSVENQRVYPKSTLASHILGYTGLMQTKEQTNEYLEKGYMRTDTIGLAGVEKSMEQWLTPNTSNRRGYVDVEVDRNGRKIRELNRVAPADGNTVKLTIDSELQQVVEVALDKIVNKIRDQEEEIVQGPGWQETNKEELLNYQAKGREIDFAQNGAAVVLDMKGRVLAMASYPSFDPNLFIQGMTTEQYVQMMQDPRRPLFNNAIMAADTPGSVFKMATALAAMVNGKLTTTETITDEGPFTVYDKTSPPKCWISKGQIGKHANQTIVEGIAHSCNYFFYTIASRLGPDGQKLYEYAAKLGLASKTNIDLPGERRSVVGSQTSLYDPTRPITLDDQDTSLPVLVKLAIKKHLRMIGEEYNISYSDERLDKCVKALMDMAYAEQQGDQSTNWVAHIRPILMEELGMSTTMVWRAAVVGEIALRLNEIKWGGSYTIQTAIGQGITLTSPIAMARYIVAIANGGYVYDVSLIDSIIAPNGEVVKSFENPTPINDLSAEIAPYLPYIKRGMAGVVDAEENGTAQAYFSDWAFKNDIAAKTGSAEKSKIDIESNAWFVAFAPYENPEVAVVFYVPHGLGGSKVSQAIRDVLDYYLTSKVEKTPLILPAPNALAQ